MNGVIYYEKQELHFILYSKNKQCRNKTIKNGVIGIIYGNNYPQAQPYIIQYKVYKEVYNYSVNARVHA